MSIVAGVDIGNSTTEVVLVDASVNPPRPIAWERTPTRGVKGSAVAAAAAAVTVRRLARVAEVALNRIVVAPQIPVESRALVLPRAPVDTGRMSLIASGRSTPAGVGLGLGRPVSVDASPQGWSGPAVLIAADPLGYRSTVERIRVWTAAGVEVVAVLLAGDEAVLVSNRLAGVLSRAVPILDQVEVQALDQAERMVVEVVEPGGSLQHLSDPVRLAALLGLGGDEHRQAEGVALTLRGLRDGAVAVFPPGYRREGGTVDSDQGAWVLTTGGARLSVVDYALGPQHRGSAVQLCIPGTPTPAVSRVADLWAVDLGLIGDHVVARANIVHGRAFALANLGVMHPADKGADPAKVLADALEVPVARVRAEVDAARAGALSSPGVRPGALVVDVGAGTIDLASADDRSVVVAGAGELLTLAVSQVLAIGRGAAEWAKRGPSSRIEGPHVLVGEDGVRHFLEVPVPVDGVGSLVVPGPAGLLPFHRSLAPGEWRALRVQLKRQVLGANLTRAVGELALGGDALLVGGPAGDAELLDVLAHALPGAVPGRAQVAGMLGHRWAVAYGLTLLDAAGDSQIVG